jgi:hypothetical protein
MRAVNKMLTLLLVVAVVRKRRVKKIAKNIRNEKYKNRKLLFSTVEEITNFDVQLVTGWVQTTKGRNIMQRHVVLREKFC